MPAYPRPTPAQRLQAQALGVLTEGQDWELEWPVTWRVWLGLWQRRNHKGALGLLVPPEEGGRALIQCDGTAATCVYNAAQQAEDDTKRPTESGSNAKHHSSGSRTAVCVTYGTHGHR